LGKTTARQAYVMLGDFDRHVAENNIADAFLRCSADRPSLF
jgi:hypothetical protein